MVQKVNIETFLQLAIDHPVIDVRSPGEFIHAHIPGAYSLPLFTDEERKVVGTAYKQQSKQHAIKLGLEYFGKKMVTMVEEVEKMTVDRCKMTGNTRCVNSHLASVNSSSSSVNSKNVLIHCWRGGMRSAGVAWLLDLYGFNVYTLVGGYKAYRNWVLKQFEKDYDFKILGGYTGSGKTEVLQELKKQGEAVIDLEQLAHHKGSAFGSIGMPEQPSQEMFENKLAMALLSTTNHQPPSIWLEDESQRIGLVTIPVPLWKNIRTKPIIFLNIPFEERLDYIIKGYGKGDKEKLVNAIIRIKKRLGGLETKTSINHLLEDDLKESFRILLAYYDKWYLKGLQSRDNPGEIVTYIESEKVDATANALKILGTVRN